jgi:hypothetical protein
MQNISASRQEFLFYFIAAPVDQEGHFRVCRGVAQLLKFLDSL